MSIEPPTLSFVDVVVEPVYVLGFPAYVALTIAAEPRDATLTRVPSVGWQGSRGMVGVTLTAPGSQQVLHQADPQPVADPDMGVPVVRLEAGERRRMLVDLTEVLPDRLDPGSYLATISFGPAALRADSAPMAIAFRPPTKREGEVLARVGAERDARGSWGQWTRLPPLDPANAALPWGPDDPLRFNWILRRLFHGTEPLAAIPLPLLDVLGGLFEPEREALRAELLAVRGDQAAFAAQVALVKRRFPALTYWMNQILSGGSEIAWTRNVRGP